MVLALPIGINTESSISSASSVPIILPSYDARYPHMYALYALSVYLSICLVKSGAV